MFIPADRLVGADSARNVSRAIPRKPPLPWSKRTADASVTAGPYAKVYAGAFSGATNAKKKSATTADDCARVMLQAIEAARPKARYGVTPLARLVKWSKRLLPDSAVDALIRRRYGVVREKN